MHLCLMNKQSRPYFPRTLLSLPFGPSLTVRRDCQTDDAPNATVSSTTTSTPAPIANPTPAPAPAPVSAAPTPAITTADLQRAMASFQALAVYPNRSRVITDGDLTGIYAKQQPKPVSLTKLLAAGNLTGVLEDPAAIEKLVQHLPEGHQTRQELEATVSSYADDC